MKFYFYFWILVYYISTCQGCDSDDESLQDLTYLPFNHIATSSVPDSLPHDLKLIKSDFEKFTYHRFFTSYSERKTLTTEQQNRIIENNVSIEIQNILWLVKSYLDKADSGVQVFNGNHFSKIIEKSLQRLLSYPSMFLESALKEEEETQTNDSITPSPSEKKLFKLSILVDRYFRSQLLAFNYALFLPIFSENIHNYNMTGSAIKLRFFHLIEDKLEFDDLESWSKKKQMFFILDQAIRHLSDPLTTDELPELSHLKGLNYKISEDYLLEYYQQSCLFLISSYGQNLGSVKNFPDLHKLSITYFGEFLSLYNDYFKIFPSLFKCQETKKLLLANLKPQLDKFYDFHMNIASQHFKDAILKCTDLTKLSDTLNEYILKTQQFNARFTVNYRQLFNSDLNLRFQETIISYFDEILYCLEHNFEANRFGITKTLSSLGWRPSQTKDFLIKMETLYRNSFPFLFDENTQSGKVFMEKFIALMKKINADEQESLNKTMETIESVKGFFKPSRWFKKDNT